MNKLISHIQNILSRIAEISFMQKIIRISRDKKILPKATCLLLAGVLWFYVENRRINEAHFRMPLQIDLAQDFAIADMEKKYITVIAKGNADDLRNVLPSGISVNIKIQNPILGSAARYPVIVTGSGLPDTVSLVPEDKTVFVTVEKRAFKQIPVIPVIEGSLDSRFIAGNIRVIPDEISISGAESVVKGINSVITEPIILTGHTESFQQSSKINAEELKYCDILQKQISVSFAVLETKGLSVIDITPNIKGFSDAYEYSSKFNGIKLLVRNEKEESISSDEFDSWCEIPPLDNKIKKGEDVTLPLTINVRAKTGRAIAAVVPEKIFIKVRKK